jgi:hypothetical protein
MFHHQNLRSYERFKPRPDQILKPASRLLTGPVRGLFLRPQHRICTSVRASSPQTMHRKMRPRGPIRGLFWKFSLQKFASRTLDSDRTAKYPSSPPLSDGLCLFASKNMKLASSAHRNQGGAVHCTCVCAASPKSMPKNAPTRTHPGPVLEVILAQKKKKPVELWTVTAQLNTHLASPLRWLGCACLLLKTRKSTPSNMGARVELASSPCHPAETFPQKGPKTWPSLLRMHTPALLQWQCCKLRLQQQWTALPV